MYADTQMYIHVRRYTNVYPYPCGYVCTYVHLHTYIRMSRVGQWLLDAMTHANLFASVTQYLPGHTLITVLQKNSQTI